MKKENLPRIRIKRSPDFKTTNLYVVNSWIKIDLRIHCALPKQQRRVIAVSFFRQFQDWLKYVSVAEITHLDDPSSDYRRVMDRGVFVSEGSKITSDLGDLGYKIRMSRLNLGFTQAELARRAGISAGQLSEIERGNARARRCTLAALLGVLAKGGASVPLATEAGTLPSTGTGI